MGFWWGSGERRACRASWCGAAHTLATQAINRGMTREAIAALLGTAAST
jgi:hypothetical protein